MLTFSSSLSGNLNRHNVLEHDGSMTRSDAYFGSNHIFNQSVFDETRSYWPDDLITAEHLANGKLARQLTSRSTNPEYTFTSTTESFSLGEVSAPIVAFGDLTTYTTNRTFVTYWIGKFLRGLSSELFLLLLLLLYSFLLRFSNLLAAGQRTSASPSSSAGRGGPKSSI